MEQNTEPTTTQQANEPTPHDRLAAMVGEWEGPARTWFEPDVLGDEARWRGSIRLALGGLFAIHEYTGTICGEQLEGMAIIGYNRMRKRYEMAWIDNNHNGSALMYCIGGTAAEAPSVLGSYTDPSGGPDWGWRTTLEMPDENTLVITAYNIPPGGEDAKAIETVYPRQTEGRKRK